jgi:acetyltransferase-like isoleucine patch superfamily enzyme
MSMMLARVAAWLFRKLQGADLHLALAELRERGQDIHTSATFGPRVQLRIADEATLRVGPGVEVLHDSWLIAHPGNTLELAERVFVSQHCTISGDVRIGRDTLIAGFVTIIDANHRFADTSRPIREQGGTSAPIVVGEDVWIGSNAVILAGVHIGDHAVVAANATVTRDVPDWAVVGGTPARVLRDRRDG